MQKNSSSASLFPMLSVSLTVHAALVAALFIASWLSLSSRPDVAPTQEISAIMVDPAMFTLSSAGQHATPEAVVEPITEPVAPPEPIKPAEVTPPPKPVVKPEKSLVRREKPKHKPIEKPRKPPRDVSRFETQVAKQTAKPAQNTVAESLPTGRASTNSSAPAGNNASPPRAISRQQPMYPRQAQRMNVEGEITVKYDVNTAGRVENIRVVKASYAKFFEKDVIKAMKKWQYEKRSAKDLQVTIVFRLDRGAQISSG